MLTPKDRMPFEPVENQRDETQILKDQDMTLERDISDIDETMGAKSTSLDDIENGPEEFIQGEIDVKEQMDRTTRAMEAAIERSSGKRSHEKLDIYQK